MNSSKQKLRIILDCFKRILYRFSFENNTLFLEYRNYHHYNSNKIIGHKIENQTNALLIIIVYKTFLYSIYKQVLL